MRNRVLLGSMAENAAVAPNRELFLFAHPPGRDHRRLACDGPVCGTGQQSIAVKDVIVPATPFRSACMSSRPAPRRVRRDHPDNPLYRTPRNLLALVSR
jgi:hypothetical protein